MRILQVHNQYRVYGGEDAVLDLESDLLRERGHRVERFTVSNKSLGKPSLLTGIETVWSRRANKELANILREYGPDLVHVHNTFPRLSPSIYWAAEEYPVVQTLHNYRLTCVNASLLRDGKPCESCVGRRLSWPGVRHRCYRDSAAASGVIATMQAVHRAAGTFKNKVDAYIALTEFVESVMVRSGMPEELIHVKPNFVRDPMPSLAETPERRDQIVFVGRLSPEKGVDLLLDAWARLKPSKTRLIIVGDGPEREKLERSAEKLPRVEWRGWGNPESVLGEIMKSQCLVMPSKWYETFGMVVIEAMSTGTPVIAPNHGGFPEIVVPGETGVLFEPGDPEDLARKLAAATTSEGASDWPRMGENARNAYLKKYTPEANYDLLMAIYEKALEQAHKNGKP